MGGVCDDGALGVVAPLVGLEEVIDHFLSCERVWRSEVRRQQERAEVAERGHREVLDINERLIEAHAKELDAARATVERLGDSLREIVLAGNGDDWRQMAAEALKETPADA